jgi:hypothetical protein
LRAYSKSYRHIVYTKVDEGSRYKRLERVLSDKRQKVESSRLKSRHFWLYYLGISRLRAHPLDRIFVELGDIKSYSMPSGWACIHGRRRRDCRSGVCCRMDLAQDHRYRRQWLCHRLRERLAFSAYRFVWLYVDDWPACQHGV